MVRRWKETPHTVEIDRTGGGEWGLIFTGPEREAEDVAHRWAQQGGFGRLRVRVREVQPARAQGGAS